jgi:hypothetical protein
MIIDTNSKCTSQVAWLVNRGVEVVGRYYSSVNPSKVITKAEARALCLGGIRLFTIYEDAGKAADLPLTSDEGVKHGNAAKAQAQGIGQPAGSVIYFALEGLPDGYGPDNLPGVRDYFNGVVGALGVSYRAGVYGDGLVCQTLLDEGLTAHTWLAQAAWTFPGSRDFYKSKRWNLAQILGDLPPDDWKGLSVDMNEGLGDIGDFLVQA